jgi:transketolase
LGIGAGIALAARLDGRDHRTVVLLGDAECDEGAIWESAMFAARHQLASLTVVIDRNRLSVTDYVPDVDASGSLETKFGACNWSVRPIDGHCFPAIFAAFADAGADGRPTVIIADTIKGKGVSFMENGIKWHHTVPGPEEVTQARKELAP